MAMPFLSKSRFLAGLQCPLRLWYASYEPSLATEPSPLLKALFDTGHKVGALARERYPGGLLIRENHFHHDDAVRSTVEAMKRPEIPAIFEGAFTFDRIRIRADILERAGDSGWNLVEVKSGTSVKDENIYDVAIQDYVMTGLGFETKQAGILTLNREYVYDGQELNLDALFTFTDLKHQVDDMQHEISVEIRDLKAVLTEEAPPEVEPSRRCRRPYACEFLDHCRKGVPDYWVVELTGIRQDRLDELAIRGILDIQDIPESFDLTALQARIRECVINNAEYVGPDLGATLRQYKHPIHFLDFEAVAPAIPRYANTHPYQTLPFQWSDHILSDDDTLTHREYLCLDDKDPREEVAGTLLESLGKEGTICTYTAFESQIISELANYLPRYREGLQALSGRYRDLYDEIRGGYYHPDFRGSFSIKNVLPVLVPSMSYKALSIREGGQAGLEYLRMIDTETPPEDRERIQKELLEYCRQDTLAMVRIREELLKRAP
jgi:hypothetical protein